MATATAVAMDMLPPYLSALPGLGDYQHLQRIASLRVYFNYAAIIGKHLPSLRRGSKVAGARAVSQIAVITGLAVLHHLSIFNASPIVMSPTIINGAEIF